MWGNRCQPTEGHHVQLPAPPWAHIGGPSHWAPPAVALPLVPGYSPDWTFLKISWVFLSLFWDSLHSVWPYLEALGRFSCGFCGRPQTCGQQLSPRHGHPMLRGGAGLHAPLCGRSWWASASNPGQIHLRNPGAIHTKTWRISLLDFFVLLEMGFTCEHSHEA